MLFSGRNLLLQKGGLWFNLFLISLFRTHIYMSTCLIKNSIKIIIVEIIFYE